MKRWEVGHIHKFELICVERVESRKRLIFSYTCSINSITQPPGVLIYIISVEIIFLLILFIFLKNQWVNLSMASWFVRIDKILFNLLLFIESIKYCRFSWTQSHLYLLRFQKKLLVNIHILGKLKHQIENAISKKTSPIFWQIHFFHINVIYILASLHLLSSKKAQLWS